MKMQFKSISQAPGFITTRGDVAEMLRSNRSRKFRAVVRKTPAGYAINGRLHYVAQRPGPFASWTIEELRSARPSNLDPRDARELLEELARR